MMISEYDRSRIVKRIEKAQRRITRANKALLDPEKAKASTKILKEEKATVDRLQRILDVA